MNLTELIAHLRTRLGQRWTHHERAQLWGHMTWRMKERLRKVGHKANAFKQGAYLDNVEHMAAQDVMERLERRT